MSAKTYLVPALLGCFAIAGCAGDASNSDLTDDEGENLERFGKPLGDAGGDSAAPAPDAGPSGPTFPGEGTPFLGTAPRATCGAGDAPDGTLSGLNGDYRCNLSVLGQVAAPHYLATAWHNDCFYVNGSDATTVIKVSPDGQPTVTASLSTVGFRSNWESMKASDASGLLVGYESNGPTLTTYDVAQDCSKPVFKSSTGLGAIGSIGHAGNFSPDGTIYYASSMYTLTVYAMDMRNPAKPVLITDQFDKSTHDLFISKGGKRGYFANPDLLPLGVGGVAIMDLTDVQAYKKGAKGKLISSLGWQDGNISQYPMQVSYDGKDYLIVTDELGSGNCNDPKKPQWGYARILDIRDEKNIKLASLVKTEAQDPANCKAATTSWPTGAFDFGLGTHYCNVDRYENPRVLACGEWNAGLRVFDIRNPWQPREVAYFDTPTANMPSMARILPEKQQIWIAVQPGTFYTLKVTPGSELANILSSN